MIYFEKINSFKEKNYIIVNLSGEKQNKNFDNIKKTLPQLNLHLIEHIRDLAKFFKK